jgi:galactose mutarotase-like enzyme
MLGLWTAVNKNAPYICIEPWHGCGAFEDETGELADKPYCITLAPNENKKLAYQVKII